MAESATLSYCHTAVEVKRYEEPFSLEYRQLFSNHKRQNGFALAAGSRQQ